MLLGLVPALELPSHAHYRPVPAIYDHAPVAEGGPLPSFGGAGTGGLEGLTLVANRPGYRQFQIVRVEPTESKVPYAPYADLMTEIKAGFGRTLSHLPAVFGVSRQTLYNWIAGELPKEQHRAKLIQLAEAAKVFSETGFKPTALMLERTVAAHKSFIELLSEGADGREIAQKLIRIVQRGSDARKKLDELLGDRNPPRLEISDMGRQSFPDEA